SAQDKKPATDAPAVAALLPATAAPTPAPPAAAPRAQPSGEAHVGVWSRVKRLLAGEATTAGAEPAPLSVAAAPARAGRRDEGSRRAEGSRRDVRRDHRHGRSADGSRRARGEGARRWRHEPPGCSRGRIGACRTGRADAGGAAVGATPGGSGASRGASPAGISRRAARAAGAARAGPARTFRAVTEAGPEQALRRLVVRAAGQEHRDTRSGGVSAPLGGARLTVAAPAGPPSQAARQRSRRCSSRPRVAASTRSSTSSKPLGPP